ncbi:MAG TPA: hypothetical protein VGE59_04230 [Patescibacteria group bacterium]
MKHEWLSSLIILAFVAAILGYGILAAQPRTSEVNAAVEEMLSVSERTAIDTSILSQPTIDKIQDFKVFGTRPTPAAPLNRTNPFEGL